MLTAVSLAVCIIGFYKYVYFISLGYGFSVAAMGGFLLFKGFGKTDALSAVLCMLLVTYGLRLGGYLLFREIKSASYRNTMKKEIKDGKDLGLWARLGTWLGCAFLYTLQVSPIAFCVLYGGSNGTEITGAVIMAFGLIFESIADFQKSKAKKKDPSKFCSNGLYKIIRCPNYFGEILFWTGVLVSGIGALRGTLMWLCAVTGYICIVYIMFGGARRLEIRQNKNYGGNLEYAKYVKQTPIIIPFVPLYSVEKYKWLVG